MRFIIAATTCAALATAAVATPKQAAHPGWDKYAGERQPSHEQHGHGVHAREAEADPARVAAWESAHGGKAPNYNMHQNDYHYNAHHARSAPSHPTHVAEHDPWFGMHSEGASHTRPTPSKTGGWENLFGQAKPTPSKAGGWEDTFGKAKPSHVARALKDLYQHYSTLADEAVENAKHSASRHSPAAHPSAHGQAHYARDVHGKMVYPPNPAKFDKTFFEKHGSIHHARDVEDDDETDYSLDGYDHELVARDLHGKMVYPSNQAKFDKTFFEKHGSMHHARDVEGDGETDYSLDGYDHELVARDVGDVDGLEEEVDSSLDGYDHELVARDVVAEHGKPHFAEPWKNTVAEPWKQYHASPCGRNGIICRAKRDVEDPEEWDMETVDENGEPVFARGEDNYERSYRRDVEDEEELHDIEEDGESFVYARDAANDAWESVKYTMA